MVSETKKSVSKDKQYSDIGTILLILKHQKFGISYFKKAQKSDTVFIRIDFGR